VSKASMVLRILGWRGVGVKRQLAPVAPGMLQLRMLLFRQLDAVCCEWSCTAAGWVAKLPYVLPNTAILHVLPCCAAC
jgi:hypothetical protein